MEDSQQAEGWAVAEDGPDGNEWRLRPLLLALLGLATGVAVHLLLGEGFESKLTTLQAAELAGEVVTAGLVGFTIERRLWWGSLLFAGVTGAIAAGVVYWNGEPAAWGAAELWRAVCMALAIAIAAPLFQAARDEGELRFPYSSVYNHAWTNIVLWCASWAFVGITFALVALLATLFNLIKIDFLQRLLEHDWFIRALVGLAFGSALGILREHGAVVRLLQRVVATVLAVLAPVLAIGLILFVLALPFTGLGALWDATKATTPILLSCVIGALILSNAVIGDTPEHESRFPLLRFGAMGLALVALPLAILAAVATGLRIGQYGFTPERLWALTFVVIASAYGLAYLVSLARGRLEWAEKVRPANLTLSMGVCVIALVLATPLISFNAISTQDQVSRLESGKVTADKFDWSALAFDFGEAGKAALKKLQASKNPQIAQRANDAAAAGNRWDLREADQQADRVKKVAANLRLLPAGSALPDDLRTALGNQGACSDDSHCTLFFLPGGTEAILLDDACFAKPVPFGQETGPTEAAVNMVPGFCSNTQRYTLKDGKWAGASDEAAPLTDAQWTALTAAYKAGTVEIRPVTRRQAFVGGVPVGAPFQ